LEPPLLAPLDRHRRSNSRPPHDLQPLYLQSVGSYLYACAGNCACAGLEAFTITLQSVCARDGTFLPVLSNGRGGTSLSSPTLYDGGLPALHNPGLLEQGAP